MEEVVHGAAVSAPVSGAAERFFDLTGELFAVLDEHGNIVRVNAAFAAFTQTTSDAARGQSLTALLRPVDPLAMSDAIARIRLGETVVNFELEVTLGPKPAIFAGSIHADGDAWYFVARDISERRRLATELEGRAGDQLGGLSNKSAFHDALDLELKMSPSAAVVLIRVVDLDRISTEHGETITNEMLQAAVSRVRRNLRSSDLMARWSSSEFTILLAGDDVGPSAKRMGNQMVDSLKRTFGVKGVRIDAHIAVGVSIGTGASHNVDSLIEQAAVAATKASHKSETAMFAIESDGPSVIGADSATTLQPLAGDTTIIVGGIFRADGGAAMGLEVFLSPKLSAMERIAAQQAGQDDLREAISIESATEALQRVAPWLAGHPSRRLCINLSEDQSTSLMLFNQLKQAATAASVDPSQVLVEIDELILARSLKQAPEIIHALRREGFEVGIDHFGLEAACLGLLHSLDVSYVKLDPSFAQTMFNNPYAAATIRAVHSVATACSVEVIATGIVHEQQLSAMRSIGCTFVQGNFIHAPEDLQAFAAKVTGR